MGTETISPSRGAMASVNGNRFYVPHGMDAGKLWAAAWVLISKHDMDKHFALIVARDLIAALERERPGTL